MAARNLLNRLMDADRDASFALIHRQGDTTIDVISGDLTEVSRIAEIPLKGQEVLALLPFRQISERGFEVRDDGAAPLCLSVNESESISVSDAVQILPGRQPTIEDFGFDITDEQYAAVVKEIIDVEIGGGQGANFVIRRDYRARVTSDRLQAAFAWYRNLLIAESGAYWTFMFCTPEVIAIGASPERHVSVTGGKVRMNPISGTLRHGATLPTETELLQFLADRKESEELVMVVDEELKMMSEVCPDGGVMRGPFLKPMSRVTHTEYLLEGVSALDPRDVLRLTMFAPTVVGSPMSSSCKIIARHEPSGRGYYSGVLARFTPTAQGYDLDAPILIRTAFVDGSGEVSVSAGATLVRHSDPMSEAAETRAKASGVLAALGLADNPKWAVGPSDESATKSAKVLEALADRNQNLAPFWRDEQTATATFAVSALLVDCEDDSTTMLAHQLRRMGVSIQVQSWDQIDDVLTPELVIFGPGPGNPASSADPRIVRIQELISGRLDARRPTIAVSLSHQILAHLAGLPIVALPSSRQGIPLTVDVFDGPALIGYYDTFTAQAPDGSVTAQWSLQVKSERATGFVHALIGSNVASVQGHLESVLSYDGFSTLAKLVKHVLAYPPSADDS